MFQGTLGHKVNHKFPPKNNCRYSWIDSARFGPSFSIKTIRNIRKGEELFGNYGYWFKTQKNFNLPWYTELYERHEEEGFGDVDVEDVDLDGVEYSFPDGGEWEHSFLEQSDQIHHDSWKGPGKFISKTMEGSTLIPQIFLFHCPSPLASWDN